MLHVQWAVKGLLVIMADLTSSPFFAIPYYLGLRLFFNLGFFWHWAISSSVRCMGYFSSWRPGIPASTRLSRWFCCCSTLKATAAGCLRGRCPDHRRRWNCRKGAAGGCLVTTTGPPVAPVPGTCASARREGVSRSHFHPGVSFFFPFFFAKKALINYLEIVLPCRVKVEIYLRGSGYLFLKLFCPALSSLAIRRKEKINELTYKLMVCTAGSRPLKELF